MLWTGWVAAGGPATDGMPAGGTAADGGTATNGRFLVPGSWWAVRAVVVSGLSDARSSQNCSSLTPPNDSVGHSSSSTSAPLRKPTRRRGLGSSGTTAASLGSAASLGPAASLGRGLRVAGRGALAASPTAHEHRVAEIQSGIWPGAGFGLVIPGRGIGAPNRIRCSAAICGVGGIVGPVASGGPGAAASRAPIGPGAARVDGPQALITAAARAEAEIEGRRDADNPGDSQSHDQKHGLHPDCPGLVAGAS